MLGHTGLGTPKEDKAVQNYGDSDEEEVSICQSSHQ
jgi:hypothetical protein